jgi:hypothetical protein
MLSAERLRELFSYDPLTGVLCWRVNKGRVRAGDVAGSPHCGGYLAVTADQCRLLVHRVAWAIHSGEWPDSIDHANGNRRDNRLENLRAATLSQNTANSKRYSTNSSGFKGVSLIPSTGRYRAYITHDGRQNWLGSFVSPEDAHAAYLAAAERLYGEFARAA